MIKGARSIAEYAIRKWLMSENFEMKCFGLAVNGNEGIVTDSTGATLRLIYDDMEKVVCVWTNEKNPRRVEPSGIQKTNSLHPYYTGERKKFQCLI